MMRHAYAFSLAAVAALCVSAAACGGNVVTGTGAGSTGAGTGTGATGTGAGTGTGATGAGTGTGATGAGGSLPGGDCTTDADCPGGTCAPITPGGWLVCLVVPPEATSCNPPMNQADQCCSSADCKQGQCWSTQTLPYCGGPAMQIYNECMTDACTSDAECVHGADVPPEICAPAGTFGEPVRFCFTAYCHTDADCTAQPGGVCRPVTGPCCAAPVGLGCVYPGGCARTPTAGRGTVACSTPRRASAGASPAPRPARSERATSASAAPPRW